MKWVQTINTQNGTITWEFTARPIHRGLWIVGGRCPGEYAVRYVHRANLHTATGGPPGIPRSKARAYWTTRGEWIKSHDGALRYAAASILGMWAGPQGPWT